MNEQPSFYDTVNKMIVNKQYSAATTMIDQEKERLKQEYDNELNYWRDAGNSDPNMADFCDNEVRVNSRGLAESYNPLFALENMISNAMKDMKK
jgi:hypothetical protein